MVFWWLVGGLFLCGGGLLGLDFGSTCQTTEMARLFQCTLVNPVSFAVRFLNEVIEKLVSKCSFKVSWFKGSSVSDADIEGKMWTAQCLTKT